MALPYVPQRVFRLLMSIFYILLIESQNILEGDFSPPTPFSEGFIPKSKLPPDPADRNFWVEIKTADDKPVSLREKGGA